MGGSSSSSSSTSSASNSSNSQLALLKQRVSKEIKEIEQNPPPNWKLYSSSTNHWSIWITAGIQTPFHSVPFQVTVKIPQNYPNQQPLIKITKYSLFFHPNISQKNGEICEKTLKKIQSLLTIRERVDAFISLLAIPNPDSALNWEATCLYKKDYHEYYRYALRKFRELSL